MEDSSNTRVRLRLLGSPRLTDRLGDEIALPARAYFLVLFVLVSGRGLSVSRSQLASFLWPEAPSAAANLRQLLVRLAALQCETGLDFIRVDRTKVALNLDRVSVDLAGLDASLRGLNWSNCQQIFGRYCGELLEGVAVKEGDLSAWLATQRTRVRNALLEAVALLLEAPDARANLRTAHALATRVLEIDAYQESAYRALMRSFAASGLIDHVAATYERCRAVLERDLSCPPSTTTVDLFRRLAPGRELRRDGRAKAVGSVALPATGGISLAVVLPRLVVLAPPRQEDKNELWETATLVLDDTIVGLSSLKTVSIVAPHTSWKLSDDGALDNAIVQQFDINYILETTLRRRHEVDELMVKLFPSRTRSIVWAESYALSDDRLAASHRSLAAAITLSLADAVEGAEMARFERVESPRAYYWHLMGQKYLRFMDLPNVCRALKAFRSSIAADPGFAPAYSGSARATQRQWLVLGRGDPKLLDEVEKIGAKAVSLDHRDARGYRELGLCSLYRRRFDDAIAYFTEAERLGPHYADLISDFGDTLGHCGEPERGLEKVERAMALNPMPPDQYWWNAAGLHFQLHNYEAALAAVDRMGDPLPALRIAAASWAYLGDDARAKKCAAKFLQSYPGFRIEHWLSIVPNKNPDDHRHYDVGLRRAGFK